MIFESGLLLPQLAGELFSASSPGPPPSGRRLTLDDIHRLCAPIFCEQGGQVIQWVGVFGVYARGKQRRDSEVEFLVGFCSHTSSAVIHKTLHVLKQALPVALGRPADVLDMRDGEIRGYAMLDALEEARGVYGDREWFLRNYLRATRWILDARYKISKAARVLMRLLNFVSPMDDVFPAVFLPENTVFRSFLVSVVAEYRDTITFDKTHPYYDAFPLVSDWILDRSDLIERLRDSTDVVKDRGLWLDLCALLMTCLAPSIEVMKDVYIPRMRNTGRNVRRVYRRYYD